MGKSFRCRPVWLIFLYDNGFSRNSRFYRCNFSIYIRRISDNKILSEKIDETSGNITWSLDDRYIFYSKLDKHHRPRTIYRHKIGTPSKNDRLIYEEKDEGFTCGIEISSDEKYFFITTSDHTTSEIYFFGTGETNPELKLFKKRQK